MDLERRYSKQFKATSLIGICSLEVYEIHVFYTFYLFLCNMLDVQDRAKRILEYAQMRSLILPYFPNEIGNLTTIRLMSTAVKLMKQSKCQRPRFKILPAICLNKIQKLRKVTWNVKIEFWPNQDIFFLIRRAIENKTLKNIAHFRGSSDICCWYFQKVKRPIYSARSIFGLKMGNGTKLWAFMILNK